jgi:hypothetical protein
MQEICTLAYRAETPPKGTSSSELQVVLMVVKYGKGDLGFLVSPHLLQIAQSSDLQYILDFLLDLPRRARRYPNALFRQLSRLSVGPLITHKATLTRADDKYLRAHCAEFVDLEDLTSGRAHDRRSPARESGPTPFERSAERRSLFNDPSVDDAGRVAGDPPL